MPKGNCVQICSLNINNATNKLEELSEYAKNNQLGIIGIQETRITNVASPIRLSGYKVHSTPSKRGEPGSVGVALCVAKHLPQVAFGKNASKYVTAAQVWLGQNIYLDRGTSYQRQTKCLHLKTSTCEKHTMH